MCSMQSSMVLLIDCLLAMRNIWALYIYSSTCSRTLHISQHRGFRRFRAGGFLRFMMVSIGFRLDESCMVQGEKVWELLIFAHWRSWGCPSVRLLCQ